MNGCAAAAGRDLEEVQVLNSSACQERMADLTAFENHHFGKGVAWSIEQNNRWANSPAALHAAVIQNASYPQIVAAMSVLVVHPNSCRQLVAGEIKEWELQPWNEGASCQHPVLYFASVIASSKADLPLLYQSLGAAISELLQREKLQSLEGLAIATSEAGRHHLERNGFRRLSDARYLHQHFFMRITALYAKTHFWRCLLTPPQAFDYPAFDPPLFPTQSLLLA